MSSSRLVAHVAKHDEDEGEGHEREGWVDLAVARDAVGIRHDLEDLRQRVGLEVVGGICLGAGSGGSRPPRRVWTIIWSSLSADLAPTPCR